MRGDLHEIASPTPAPGPSAARCPIWPPASRRPDGTPPLYLFRGWPAPLITRIAPPAPGGARLDRRLHLVLACCPWQASTPTAGGRARGAGRRARRPPTGTHRQRSAAASRRTLTTGSPTRSSGCAPSASWSTATPGGSTIGRASWLPAEPCRTAARARGSPPLRSPSWTARRGPTRSSRPPLAYRGRQSGGPEPSSSPWA